MLPGVIFVNSDVLHPLNSIAVGGGEGLNPKNPTPEVSHLNLPPFEVHNRPAFSSSLLAFPALLGDAFLGSLPPLFLLSWLSAIRVALESFAPFEVG